MCGGGAIWGSFGYEKALYLDELSDGAIAVISEHVPRKVTPLSFVPTFTMNGKYRAVPEADTAFGGSRSAGFVFNIEAAAPTRELYEADRIWARNFWDAMRPRASGSGTYVNFMSESDEARVKASYGAQKFARLVRIKTEWDPDNVFQLNANRVAGGL